MAGFRSGTTVYAKPSSAPPVAVRRSLGRTMIPADSYVHYHESHYRENGIAPTGVIYHAGFRIAERRDQL